LLYKKLIAPLKKEDTNILRLYVYYISDVIKSERFH